MKKLQHTQESVLSPLLVSIFFFLAAGVFIILITPRSSYLGLVVAGLIGLLAVLIYPLIGLALYIPAALFLSGYYVLIFPLRYYILAAIFISILLKSLIIHRQTLVTPLVKKMIVVGLIYLSWIVIRQFQYNNHSIFSAINSVAGDFAVGFLIAIAIFYICDNPAKIQIALNLLIGWVALSAFVGVMQFFEVEYFKSLGDFVIHLISNENAQQELFLAQQGKGVIGLTGLALLMGYTISFMLPITLSIYYFGEKKLYILKSSILLVILFSGLIASFVMSGILATIFACAIVLYLWNQKRGFGILAGIVFALAVIFLSQTFIPGLFIDNVLDSNGLARIPLFIVGLKVGLNNLWGISPSQYGSEVIRFAGGLSGYTGYNIIFTTGPHNNYINVLVRYGFPGLVMYIAFTFLLVKNFVSLWKQSGKPGGKEYRPLVIGLIGAFLAAFLNSMVHNSGLFKGETIAWFGVGIIWALSSQLNNQLDE
jgi:hypothetical protein